MKNYIKALTVVGLFLFGCTIFANPAPSDVYPLTPINKCTPHLKPIIINYLMVEQLSAGSRVTICPLQALYITHIPRRTIGIAAILKISNPSTLDLRLTITSFNQSMFCDATRYSCGLNPFHDANWWPQEDFKSESGRVFEITKLPLLLKVLTGTGGQTAIVVGNYYYSHNSIYAHSLLTLTIYAGKYAK